MQFRKIIMVAAAVAAFIAVGEARAERISAGTLEFGLSGLFDFDAPNGTSADINMSAGYFPVNGVLIGAGVSLYSDDDVSSYGFSAKIEQHFETGMMLVPYVGASAGLLAGDYYEKSETALVFGIAGGLKFYLTEWVALDVSMHLDMATSDVYVSDGEPDNMDTTLFTGLRISFR